LGRNGKSSLGRRTFLGAAGAGAVTTTLAGCLGGVGGDDDDGIFKIGHLAPTGMAMGVGSERSAEIAVDEVGKVRDQEIELISENTETDPGGTSEIVERMIVEDNVDLLVGTFSSEVTQRITGTIADEDVPFIITGSADQSTMANTTGDDYEHNKNIFRTGPINSELQAEAMADYAEFLSDEHGWNTFGHLSEEAAWTKSFQELLPDELRSRGFDVPYDDTVSLSTDNYTSILDDLESEGVDAVLRFFASGGQGKLLKPWITNRYPFAVEGTHVASMNPEFWGQTEGICQYETTAQSGGGGVTDITDKTMDFVETYQDEYGDDGAPTKPMYMGFNTYDAIHFYSEVAEEAGTINYNDDLDDIVEAMHSVEYTGAAAEISLYGEDSDYPNDAKETRTDGKISNYPVTQWQPNEDDEGGHQELVYPAANSSGDHIAPPWM